MSTKLDKEKDVKNRSAGRGRRRILQLIFGPVGMLILFLLTEILLLLLLSYFMDKDIFLFLGGYQLFSLFLWLVIVSKVQHPAFQSAWASLVLLFPVFGWLLFVCFRFQPGIHRMTGKMQETTRRTADLLTQDPVDLQRMANEDIRMAQLASYIGQMEGYPVCRNTEVIYFPSGEEKFEELKNQLLAAENFIFLEYSFVEEGYLWNSIEEILKQKVKEGIEVRLLYDGMNALSNLPHDFSRRLENEGIRCRVFSPGWPVHSVCYNNRDHRKIAVIDGYIAFTGGADLADKCINRESRFGHWKDAAVMLRGEAAKSFLVMFLRMWDSLGEPEDLSEYLWDMRAVAKQADGFVLPFSTAPFSETQTAERVYLEILNTAVRYVHIMMPCLIPDHELLQTLAYTARRGVDVKLILPHIPDKKAAYALSHAYYKQLQRAGVRIYEYTPGFMHSKVVVSDDTAAVVGTVNFNYRSLYLDFECAALFYQVPEIRKMEADFRRTLSKCQLITAYDIRHEKLARRIAGQFLKIIAPFI